jgi:hypothetical protein
MRSIGVLFNAGGQRPPLATLSHKGRGKRALLSSYCIAIDVIVADQINAIQTTPCDPPGLLPEENFDVA